MIQFNEVWGSSDESDLDHKQENGKGRRQGPDCEKSGGESQ